MKILKIDKMPKADGGFIWSVTIPKKDGTPSKSPLIEQEEPTYQVGDDVPRYAKLIKPQEGNWYYVWADEPDGGQQPKAKAFTKGPFTKPAKTYTADPAKIDSIELQNNKNNTTQIYCHVTDPGTPFNKDLFNEIFQIVKATGAENYLVKEAKKLGAVEQ